MRHVVRLLLSVDSSKRPGACFGNTLMDTFGNLDTCLAEHGW